jgi:EAL domain-containing protein (putative c-di-GMP-specific phosphodiesterase class I)
VAEESGLIADIGAWAIREACAQLRDWRRRDPSTELRLSVNLGARELSHRDVVLRVLGAVRSAGMDPSSLCIEVTESTAMADRASGFRARRQLSATGVRVAIDDFGTGHSSLDHLRTMPADVLKIDRSFVQGISEDTADTALVAATLALGRALGMEVVAEGIETEQQASSLRELACPIAQGNLFAHPLPAEELDGLLEAGLRL